MDSVLGSVITSLSIRKSLWSWQNLYSECYEYSRKFNALAGLFVKSEFAALLQNHNTMHSLLGSVLYWAIKLLGNLFAEAKFDESNLSWACILRVCELILRVYILVSYSEYMYSEYIYFCYIYATLLLYLITSAWRTLTLMLSFCANPMNFALPNHLFYTIPNSRLDVLSVYMCGWVNRV